MLARPFRMSLPAISRHLRVLERARLIQRHRSGRLHLIRARAAGLRDAREWIARCAAHWDAQFDALPIGARVLVIPNHACMTAAMYGEYLVTDGGLNIAARWPRTNGWD